MANEVFGATFTRSKRHDPTTLKLTVPPGVRWAVQVWAGKYVAQTAPTPSV